MQNTPTATHTFQVIEFNGTRNETLPYARASVVGRKAAVTCGSCGEVFVAKRGKSEKQQYAEHFESLAVRS